jgi:hypothetical protein
MTATSRFTRVLFLFAVTLGLLSDSPGLTQSSNVLRSTTDWEKSGSKN